MPSATIMQAPPISEYAIIVAPSDNLAVVKEPTEHGTEVTLPSGRVVCVRAAVPPGHRFATRDIPAGDFVLQYGQPIGTSPGIRRGDYITHANMSDDVPVVRALPDDLSAPPPVYIPEPVRATFRGFRRPDGRAGTRNFVSAPASSSTPAASRAARCWPGPRSTSTGSSSSGPSRPSRCERSVGAAARV